MKILLDDGMQIKVGTGIGKYSLYLFNELKKVINLNDVLEIEQYDRGSFSKKRRRLRYLLHINSPRYYD